MTAYEIVKKSREKGRPTALCYIREIVEDFVELHGDRRYSDDRAIVGGVGRVGGMPVTVIGIEKGADTQDKIAHNFGCAHPEGYRKAVRLMKQAEKFRRPVLCFVDTSGAYCGIGAEERGQSEAIATSILEMIRTGVRLPQTHRKRPDLPARRRARGGGEGLFRRIFCRARPRHRRLLRLEEGGGSRRARRETLRALPQILT